MHQLGGKAQAEGELARVVGLESFLGMNRLAEDCFRMLFRDFLDFHAARGAGHEHGRADGAVHEHAEVNLALDIEPFFDQHAADDAALWARLRRDELHAQNLLRRVPRLLRPICATFTPPPLPRPPA